RAGGASTARYTTARYALIRRTPSRGSPPLVLSGHGEHFAREEEVVPGRVPLPYERRPARPCPAGGVFLPSGLCLPARMRGRDPAPPGLTAAPPVAGRRGRPRGNAR